VFEATSPAPDGQLHVSHAATSAAWKPIFGDVTSRFTVEDSFTAGDHVAQRWRYDWGGGHVRGIDVFTVKDGKVTEKIAYLKRLKARIDSIARQRTSDQCPRLAVSRRTECPDPGGDCLHRHQAGARAERHCTLRKCRGSTADRDERAGRQSARSLNDLWYSSDPSRKPAGKLPLARLQGFTGPSWQVTLRSRRWASSGGRARAMA
jgi:SnoaL-like domain